MTTKRKTKPTDKLTLKERMAKLRVEDVSKVKHAIIEECGLNADKWRNRMSNKTVPSKPEQIIIDRIINGVMDRYKMEFSSAK